MLLSCLLNAFASCVGEVNVFSLEVIVLFLGCVVFLATVILPLVILSAIYVEQHSY